MARKRAKALFSTTTESFIRTSAGVFRVAGAHRSPVCGWLKLQARLEYVDADSVAIEVQIGTGDGRKKRLEVPPAEFLDHTRIRDRLINAGLEVADPQAFKALLMGLWSHCQPRGRKLVTRSSGWQSQTEQGVFVTGAWTFPHAAEDQVEIVLEAEATSHVYERGSLKQWNTQIGRFCEGNSRLVLSLCAALAPPALHLVDLPSFGFCLTGPSSKGKTTALEVAASAWGHPDQYVETWNATKNALGALAARYNDMPLILDDMSQANPGDVSQIVYGMANGSARRRLIGRFQLNEKQSPRVIVAASNETTVREYLRHNGLETALGQSVRLLGVPVLEQGVFSRLHGLRTRAKAAQRLHDRVRRFHGSLAPAWVGELAMRPKNNTKRLHALMESFQAQVAPCVPVGLAPNIAARAARNFSLFAAVGERAIECGLLPWSVGSANWAVRKCFSAWADNECSEQAEEVDPLLQVRKFFQSNSDGHFQPFDKVNDADHRHQLAGYTHALRGEAVFLVLQAWFEHEFCKRAPRSLLLKALSESGYLICGSGGRWAKQVRMPGGDDRRQFYVVRRSIMNP
jgi:putative DNA primase/helicase